ncbi:MAG: hypothetical protein AABZ60_09075, partial [Planctomycetota bacterium]
MLWNLLQQRLDVNQVQTLQEILELLKTQDFDASALVVAVDLEYLTWEQSESLLQSLSEPEKREEIFRQEKYLGQMGISSGFVIESDVAEALQQLDPSSNTLLWKYFENRKLVQDTDFMTVIKARKAIVKQTLKVALLSLAKKKSESTEKQSTLKEVSKIPKGNTLQENPAAVMKTMNKK